MNKLSLIAMLVLVSTCQDVKILAESGSEGVPLEIVEAADGSALPMREPLAPTTTLAEASSILPGGCDVPTREPSQPLRWDLLWQNPIGGNCKWVHPKGQIQILPKLWTSSYGITFESDCPQNPAQLSFSVTGVGFVYLNGQLVHSWYVPFQVHHLQLSGLKCGTNKVKIVVYNYYFSSPCALLYSISQSTANCYQCRNEGVTFYNKRTCQCECVDPPHTCFNPLTSYFGYPKCGCACTTQQICPSNRFWNPQSCAGDGNSKCCPRGYYQDKATCECKKYTLCVKQICKPGY